MPTSQCTISHNFEIGEDVALAPVVRGNSASLPPNQVHLNQGESDAHDFTKALCNGV